MTPNSRRPKPSHCFPSYRPRLLPRPKNQARWPCYTANRANSPRLCPARSPWGVCSRRPLGSHPKTPGSLGDPRSPRSPLPEAASGALPAQVRGRCRRRGWGAPWWPKWPGGAQGKSPQPRSEALTYLAAINGAPIVCRHQRKHLRQLLSPHNCLVG